MSDVNVALKGYTVDELHLLYKNLDSIMRLKETSSEFVNEFIEKYCKSTNAIGIISISQNILGAIAERFFELHNKK